MLDLSKIMTHKDDSRLLYIPGRLVCEVINDSRQPSITGSHVQRWYNYNSTNLINEKFVVLRMIEKTAVSWHPRLGYLQNILSSLVRFGFLQFLQTLLWLHLSQQFHHHHPQTTSISWSSSIPNDQVHEHLLLKVGWTLLSLLPFFFPLSFIVRWHFGWWVCVKALSDVQFYISLLFANSVLVGDLMACCRCCLVLLFRNNTRILRNLWFSVSLMKKKKTTEVSPRLKSTLLEDKEFWFGEQRLVGFVK